MLLPIVFNTHLLRTHGKPLQFEPIQSHKNHKPGHQPESHFHLLLKIKW